MRFLFSGFLIVISPFLFSQNEVIYMWSGALTHTSVKVNAKMTDTSTTLRLVVDEDSTFASPLFSSYYYVNASSNFMVSMEITGLTIATEYFYCVESGGIMDTSASDIGSFKTFGYGPYTFSFVTSSCAVDSDHPSYQKMREMNPDFYVNTGDLHYSNPNSGSDINIHRMPYETEVLSKQRAAELFREVPIVYVWDDHDYCGDNSDSSYIGKENARAAYHEYVPHYPLGLGSSPWVPISQAFTVGRIRFILTDLRSGRSASSMFSPEQMIWFENEMLDARDNNQMIAWINPTTWNNISGGPSDNWGGPNYLIDRFDLSSFFNGNNIKNMFMICSDAHMLAIDDGTNADFSGFAVPYLYPIFQAAAINADGSYKGGTFNQGGTFLNPDYTWGQFGRVLVNDIGSDSICITFEGYRVDSSGSNFSMLNSYTFCREVTHVGIEEESLLNEVSIQPNPGNSLNLVFNRELFLRSIKIFDLNGRVVFNESIMNPVCQYSSQLSSLGEGSYLIEIESDKGTLRKLWIKG